jgi:hypothetical protein
MFWAIERVADPISRRNKKSKGQIIVRQPSSVYRCSNPPSFFFNREEAAILNGVKNLDRFK